MRSCSRDVYKRQALISVVAPLIVYMVVPGSFGEWLSTLIPAGGIGLSNALLYKMISLSLIHI